MDSLGEFDDIVDQYYKEHNKPPQTVNVTNAFILKRLITQARMYQRLEPKQRGDRIHTARIDGILVIIGKQLEITGVTL